MKIPSFNSIANVLASVSAVGLAGIVGAGTYIFVNKDAIIDDVKDAAIESVLDGMGGGALGGGSLPLGSNDLPAPEPQAAAPDAPTGFGLPQ